MHKKDSHVRKHAQPSKAYPARSLSAGAVAIALGVTALGSGIALANTPLANNATATSTSTHHEATAHNGEPVASTPRSTATATPTTLDKIKLPEYAGAIAHDYFVPQEEGGTHKDNKYVVPHEQFTKVVLENAQIKQMLADNSIDLKNIEASVDTKTLDTVFAKIMGNGRKPQLVDVKVTLKDTTNNTTKDVKVKLFYYAPPFAHGTDRNEQKCGIGKINFDDPNTGKLTSEQKTALIDQFLEVNKDLGLSKDKMTMDDDGNLTITNNGWTTVIPGSEFVSVVGKVEDFWIFANPSNNTQSMPIGPENQNSKTITIKIKKGTYADVRVINNPLNDTFNNGLSGAKSSYDPQTGLLTITGIVNAQGQNSKMLGVRGVVRVHVNNGDDKKRWKRHLSNTFRIIGIYTDTNTLIRSVDEEDHERLTNPAEDLKAALSAATRGIQYGGNNPFNNVDQKFEKDPGINVQKVNAEIAKNLKKNVNTQKFKHEVGAQIFKAQMETPKFGQKSAELDVKLVYYTKKIPLTVVANKGQLTAEEKTTIENKVKTANGWDKNNNNFTVSVSNDGNVKITYKDHNLMQKDGKKKQQVEINLGQPIITLKYDDKKVPQGDKETSEIIKDKDLKYPNGITFAKPDDAPNGLEVDSQTGKITYTPGKDKKPGDEITGKITVTIPAVKQGGQPQIVEVPYKFIVEKESSVKVKYVVKNPEEKYDTLTEIDSKFRLEDANNYPTTVTGKKDTSSLGYFGNSGKPAPKFVGYKFVKTTANRSKGNFTQEGTETLLVVYEKRDEIVVSEDGKTPKDCEGYVKVTFKAGDNASLGKDKKSEIVYYVNPKAGVKLVQNGAEYNLIGKNAEGKELKINVPQVTAGKDHVVNYHKEGDNQTTTWGYDNYAQVGQEITKPADFTAQVKEDDTTTYTPTYQDTNAKIGQESKVPAPTYTDKAGKPIDQAKLPSGIKYAKTDKTPSGVSVDEKTGELKVTLDNTRKIGDVVEIPVEVTYPDTTKEVVIARVTASAELTTKPTLVKNVKSLTDDEKNAVKKAIKDNNPSLPDNAEITVDTDGTTTVKVNGKLIHTFKPEATVFAVNNPVKTFVKNPASLSEDEKKAVKQAVENANKNNKGVSTLPQGVVIDVDAQGNVTIKESDKPGAQLITTIPAAETVYTVVKPDKTIVDDTSKLTNDEKTQVLNAFKAKNKDLPNDITVEVGTDGTITLKKGTDTVTTIPGTEVVEQRATTPTPSIDPVKTNTTTITGKSVPNATVKVTIPGVEQPIEVTADDNGVFKVPVPRGVVLTKDDTISATAQKTGEKVSQPGTTKVLDTTNNEHKPEAGTIGKKFGEPTTVDEIISKVSIPNYPENAGKPVFKVVDASKIPDGQTAGEYPVDVLITYPDGSTTTVTVTVTVAPQGVTPAPTLDPLNVDATKVTGKSEPNAQVTVTFPNGKTVTTTADEHGDFSVDVPQDVVLHGDDTVTAIAQGEGLAPSSPSSVIVAKLAPSPEPLPEEEESTDNERNEHNEHKSHKSHQSQRGELAATGVSVIAGTLGMFVTALGAVVTRVLKRRH